MIYVLQYNKLLSSTSGESVDCSLFEDFALLILYYILAFLILCEQKEIIYHK